MNSRNNSKPLRTLRRGFCIFLIELTYNSNHIEGSKLTHDETRYIYETNTIGIGSGNLNVDDIVEAVNHFRCIDYIIKNANKSVTEKMIKEIHYLLKNGTSDSRKSWFAVGDYKRLPNEVGGMETTDPKKVHDDIKKLLDDYQKNERYGYTCSKCTDACSINLTGQLSEKYNAKTVIGYNSSEIYNTKAPSQEIKYGIVGIACVLNLISGGLKAKELGYVPQCVVLDYCGCKQHWNFEGLITNFNRIRLEKILKCD